MSSVANEQCRLCGSLSRFEFRQPLLGRQVNYFDCATCGYFQTQQPHWLNEAYASAINDVDTGILWRNLLNVRRVVMTLVAFGCLKGRVLDHAGGYGILVRLLRDAGVDALWSDKYCQNLVARGFEASDLSYDLITAFELFEHLERPLEELDHLLKSAPVVLMSTELLPALSPPSPDWWYLGSEHGQHIGFFRARTLAWMARRLDCNYASDRSLHVFARGRSVPRRWQLLQRLNTFAPLMTATLGSRTQSDFDALRKVHREPAAW